MKLYFNLIPIVAPEQEIVLKFFTENVNNACIPLSINELPKEYRKLHNKDFKYLDYLYCDIDNLLSLEGNQTIYDININLNKTPNFALHYFRHLIYNYFRNIKDIVISTNMINDIEIYLPAKEQTSEIFTLYYCFTIKLQHKHVSDNFEMVVSYDGNMRKLNLTLPELRENERKEVSNVIIGNVKYHVSHDSSIVNYIFDKAYPILSNRLKKLLNIKLSINRTENKYQYSYKLIEGFCKKYIFSEKFKEIIQLADNTFLAVPENNIGQLPDDSHKLLFRDFRQNIVESTDPIQYLRTGPYQIAQPSHKQLRIIFIYQKGTGEEARNYLYKLLSEGIGDALSQNGTPYKRIKPMYQAIRSLFFLEKDIVFSSLENSVSEIKNELEEISIDLNKYKYLAIYISPISNIHVDSPYYDVVLSKIKEALISKEITVQGIYEKRINDEKQLQYHFTNIYSAILAKIDGVPWTFKSDNPENLIIGVGAYYSPRIGKRYIGCAFNFNGNGVFSEYSCTNENTRDMLVKKIREAVVLYIHSNKTKNLCDNDIKLPKMIVIHFYKKMSRKDWEPILKMLNELKCDIPIVVVTINKTETKDIMAFDNEVADKMPLSGTYIKVDKNTYLVYNNAKYNQEEFNKNKGRKLYHYPIKIHLESNDANVLKNKQIINEIIKQVHQLSRINWKTTDTQSLPITVTYPEYLARYIPYFTNEVL